jgi:hypothetical protein
MGFAPISGIQTGELIDGDGKEARLSSRQGTEDQKSSKGEKTVAASALAQAPKGKGAKKAK